MALILYLTKAPRYQNIITGEYETIPFSDLVLIDKYYFWSMLRAEGKTDALALEEWCGIPENKLPHKYVVNYYRAFFTKKHFHKEYDGDIEGFSIFAQAARIVKANQIFRWFIENVMNGNPDREHYEVTEHQLADLLSTCRRVQHDFRLVSNDEYYGKQFSVDELVAKQHLPLMEETCYFFGTNQYDTVYATNVIKTLEVIKHILDTTDFEKEVIYFNATW